MSGIIVEHIAWCLLWKYVASKMFSKCSQIHRTVDLKTFLVVGWKKKNDQAPPMCQALSSWPSPFPLEMHTVVRGDNPGDTYRKVQSAMGACYAPIISFPRRHVHVLFKARDNSFLNSYGTYILSLLIIKPLSFAFSSCQGIKV